MDGLENFALAFPMNRTVEEKSIGCLAFQFQFRFGFGFGFGFDFDFDFDFVGSILNS
jgi:hypothetical protein